MYKFLHNQFMFVFTFLPFALFDTTTGANE